METVREKSLWQECSKKGGSKDPPEEGNVDKETLDQQRRNHQRHNRHQLDQDVE